MEKLFIKALRALIKSIRDMKGNSPSANTKQVANVMVYLLQQLETFVNTIIGSATIGGRRWFLPKMENQLNEFEHPQYYKNILLTLDLYNTHFFQN